MKLVIIESPYAGNIELNVAYARAAMLDCLERGEAPYASHLLYTQVGVLDDSDPVERSRGIEAGLQWGKHADMTVVYEDFGLSEGMKQGIARAEAEGRPIEYRTLSDARMNEVYQRANPVAYIKPLSEGTMDGIRATMKKHLDAMRLKPAMVKPGDEGRFHVGGYITPPKMFSGDAMARIRASAQELDSMRSKPKPYTGKPDEHRDRASRVAKRIIDGIVVHAFENDEAIERLLAEHIEPIRDMLHREMFGDITPAGFAKLRAEIENQMETPPNPKLCDEEPEEWLERMKNSSPSIKKAPPRAFDPEGAAKCKLCLKPVPAAPCDRHQCPVIP